MEKHTSKKLIAGLCALSAAFILASCDPITATPNGYDNAIVLDKDGNKVDLKDNLMGKIYDAIATDRNTKIVSNILDEIATKRFGEYYEFVNATKDADAKLAFVKKYAEAFGYTNAASENDALHRFEKFAEDVNERISESFYNEIKSGSYEDDDKRFDEGKLATAHYYDFYDIGNRTAAKANKFYVTTEITKENAFSKLVGKYDVVDERNAYEQDTSASKAKFDKRGYIEEKIYPQILKDKLVEEYVYNTSYSALGRSYARKVNYIKVSYEDHVIPWKLLKNFAATNIETADNIDFASLENAIKGMNGIGEFVNAAGDGVKALSSTDYAYTLLKSTLGDPAEDVYDADGVGEYTVKVSAAYKMGSVELVPAGTYFKNTKLGETIVSYKKALKAIEQGRFATPTNKAELDKFTASGKSHEYGLREKLISLAKEDYTTDGWYVKNGGLSELPSALRDRLFNINVANSLDDASKLVLENADNMGAYELDDNGNQVKRLPYMRNIYGKKLVIPAKSQSYAENPYNYIYQDTAGKAFYIVEVLEAPSTPKLNKDSATAYTEPYRIEDLARQVAKVLGTKDSYIKDAYTEYLEKYTFSFYETSLYEHFKAEYPDLFEEE